MMSILYSFPWSIGASGVGYTAWEHVNELGKLGLKIHLISGKVEKKFDYPPHNIKQSMSLIGVKIPAKFFGGIDNAAKFHDYITATYIKKYHKYINLFHGWPMASELSIKTAKKYGIATFLERPNTHTQFAFETIKKVYQDLGLTQKSNQSHTTNLKRLNRELREFRTTDFLLCPSRFVVDTFLERGFPLGKLLQHQYGFNPARIKCDIQRMGKFKIVFIGNDAPRKGLHNILKAWQLSEANKSGEFLIYGNIDQEFLKQVEGLLDTNGVIFKGFTDDVSSALSGAHCFVLSSYEEGSALVTYEARAAGCVLLTSTATGAIVKNNINGLLHKPGEINELARQINSLFNDRNELERLRKNSLQTLELLTWEYSAKKLITLYAKHKAKLTNNESTYS